MPITILGEHPLAMDDQGNLRNPIGTVFVGADVLITGRRSHFELRPVYTAYRNQQQTARGLPPLSEEDLFLEWLTAVDLILADGYVHIRPDPDNMKLAFEADLLLQEAIPKRLIKFMFVRNDKVQQSIRRRGEYWRVSPVPVSLDAIAEKIRRSRIALGGRAIYYYSATTGTRFLTVQEFAALGDLDDQELRLHMEEIRRYAALRNRFGYREISFFGADTHLNVRDLVDGLGEGTTPADVRDSHARVLDRIRLAVPTALRVDNIEDSDWRNHMFACLMGEKFDAVADDLLKGVTPEFFRSIRWLPGGRIERGELVFDSVFSKTPGSPRDEHTHGLCDERVKGFICNYLREFGRLEYVNIGQLSPDLCRHPRAGGHRAYIAEVKHQGASEPVVRIIRVQTWGIREHLDKGMDLLPAILESEEYTEYILDRRLGCWQLGMPLPSRIDAHRLSETYTGKTVRHLGRRIWTTYFERDFIVGVATDKIAPARFQNEAFALAFARLLGQAAAPNLVVGRKGHAGRIKFDGGDEVLILDADNMPQRIVVADHAGTFVDFESELDAFAGEYANPVTSRVGLLANPAAFADAYVGAFAEQFRHMQKTYRSQRRAFDSLFQNSKPGPKTFSDRWAKALARMDRANGAALAERIRDAIRTHV